MLERPLNYETSYVYDVFSLRVHSDIFFPELSVVLEESSINVRIICSSDSSDIHFPISESADFSVNHLQAVLKGDGFDLTIKNGQEIIIHDHGVQRWELVRLRILGAAFGVLLQQRGMLVLHGATIVGPKGAVIILGHSGDGKSTLTGQLVKLGYAAMGDDKSIISCKKPFYTALSSYPFIKLSETSATELGFSDGAMHIITQKHNKRYIDLGEHYFSDSAPVKAFFVLSQSVKPTVAELSQMEAFGLLMEHSYRRKKLFGIGAHKQHFLQCNQLTQSLPIFSYQRSFEGGILHAPDIQFLTKLEALIGYE